MLRVCKHVDFQKNIFEASTYPNLKYRAIPISNFQDKLLSNILEAFGQEEREKLLVEMPERQHLLQEIRALCIRRKWDFSQEHLLVVGYGVGQLFQFFKPAGELGKEEQEEMALKLIRRYADIFCILDTDIMPDGTMNPDSAYNTGDTPTESQDEIQPAPTENPIPVVISETQILHRRVETQQEEVEEALRRSLIQEATLKEQEQELRHLRSCLQAHRDDPRPSTQALSQGTRSLSTPPTLASLSGGEENSRRRFDIHQDLPPPRPPSLNLHGRSVPTTPTSVSQRPAGEPRRNFEYRDESPSQHPIYLNHLVNVIEEMRKEIQSLKNEKEEWRKLRQQVNDDHRFSFEPEEEPRKPRNTLSLISSSLNKPHTGPAVTFESRDFKKCSTKSPSKRANRTGQIKSEKRRSTLPKPNFDSSKSETEEESSQETTSDEETSPLLTTPRLNTVAPSSPLRRPSTRNRTQGEEKPKPYKLWTLKQLGIRQYDPQRNDLLSHVEKVTRILEEVKVSPESQKIRLLMSSFPAQLEYYEQVVSQANRGEYRKFAKELLAIMGSKVRVTAH